MSGRPLTPNRWGTFADASYPVNFHSDGRIGLAIAEMGRDAMIDVDCEPLADALGRAATDAVGGWSGQDRGRLMTAHPLC